MTLIRWLLAIPLLVVGLLLGFFTFSNTKKVAFSGFIQAFESVFNQESNLFLKLRQINQFSGLNHKILAMIAWSKKTEDKNFALVGGADIFVSDLANRSTTVKSAHYTLEGLN